MKKGKDLPEEKLLRLIKEGKRPNAALSLPADIVISEKNDFLKLRLAPGHLSLCGALLLGLSALMLLKSLFFPLKFGEESGGGDAWAKPEAKTVKTLDAYLAGISTRTWFRQETASAGTGLSGGREAILPDLVKDLNLLGVVAGENAQAIIENKKDQQTYYLSNGQFIDEMKVADIQEDKVILEYKGKRAELHL